jgi:hypothetical protein
MPYEHVAATELQAPAVHRLNSDRGGAAFINRPASLAMGPITGVSSSAATE